jgi:serine/threonine protein kinase
MVTGMNNQRFTQVEFMASGGFAKVYRAVDLWTQRTVAIKQLSNATPDLLQRFKRERDMLTIHADNPFVVNIFDSSFEGPNPYLVLEYASLGSLQQYVVKRRDWRRVGGWLFDIGYGLTIIHERGDFVRDIKPSNLLRFKRADGCDLIKIADFGLAQRPDDLHGRMTTSVFGTKGYIDPVAQVSGKFRAASDIYSLGITAIELLTGARNVRSRVPGPPEFQALVASMICGDVDKRPTARETFEQVEIILRAATAPQAEAPNSNGLGWLLAGAAVVVGACLLTKAE